jgi:hypothetical protein
VSTPPFYEPINLIKSILSDNQQLATDLLAHMDETRKAIKGLAHAAPTILTNESGANTRKMLNVTMNLVKQQQELNQLLIAVVVMLLSSSDFTQWQAELAMKLGGDNQSILREMLRRKMEGR